jgi:hypothetical protein
MLVKLVWLRFRPLDILHCLKKIKIITTYIRIHIHMYMSTGIHIPDLFFVYLYMIVGEINDVLGLYMCRHMRVCTIVRYIHAYLHTFVKYWLAGLNLCQTTLTNMESKSESSLVFCPVLTCSFVVCIIHFIDNGFRFKRIFDNGFQFNWIFDNGFQFNRFFV